MQTAPHPPLDNTGDSGQAGSLIPSSRVEYYEQSRPGWQAGHGQQPQPPQQGPVPGPVGSYSPSGRIVGASPYNQQGNQGQHQEGSYEYQGQHEQPTPSTAAALLHQQEQRGVSQLQSAVSAATGGAGRNMMQLPGTSQTPGPNQSASSLAGMGAGVLQTAQNEATRRGPVEFNHAISYVNKIKVH